MSNTCPAGAAIRFSVDARYLRNLRSKHTGQMRAWLRVGTPSSAERVVLCSRVVAPARASALPASADECPAPVARSFVTVQGQQEDHCFACVYQRQRDEPRVGISDNLVNWRRVPCRERSRGPRSALAAIVRMAQQHPRSQRCDQQRGRLGGAGPTMSRPGIWCAGGARAVRLAIARPARRGVPD
jgi:hypothetical protein